MWHQNIILATWLINQSKEDTTEAWSDEGDEHEKEWVSVLKTTFVILLQDGLFPADYVALRDSLKVQQMLYDARTLNVYAQVGICWIRLGFLKKIVWQNGVKKV